MSLTSQQFRQKLHAERPLHRLEALAFSKVRDLELLAILHGYDNDFTRRLYSVASKILGYSPKK